MWMNGSPIRAGHGGGARTALARDHQRIMRASTCAQWRVRNRTRDIGQRQEYGRARIAQPKQPKKQEQPGCCYYAVGLRSQPREEGFNPIQNSCQSRKSCNRLFLVFAVGLVNGAARFPAVIVWPIPPSKRSATRTVCGMPRVDCGDPRLPSAAPPFPPRARRFDPGHHGPPRAPVRPPSPSHRP